MEIIDPNENDPVFKVIEAMNAEIVRAQTQEQQDAIFSRYDVLLTQAQTQSDQMVDQQLATLDAQLEAERLEIEAEIKKQEDEDAIKQKEREEEQQKEIDQILEDQKDKEKEKVTEVELQALRKKYTVKKLKVIAKEHNIDIPARSKEMEIIKLLLSNNVEL